MKDTKYNGWSNKATWLAYKEFFSELSIEDLEKDFRKCNYTSEFAETLQLLLIHYCHYEDNHKDIVRCAISYFMDDINFDELASAYAQEITGE